MALIAGGRGLAAGVVTGRFAGCLQPVVASDALSWLGRTVVIARTQESRCIEVTVFAWSIGHDVAGGFRRCHDASAKRMAAIAVPRCALEYPACMTGLACSRGMYAGKREAGGHMVEIAPTQLFGGHGL